MSKKAKSETPNGLLTVTEALKLVLPEMNLKISARIKADREKFEKEVNAINTEIGEWKFLRTATLRIGYTIEQILYTGLEHVHLETIEDLRLKDQPEIKQRLIPYLEKFKALKELYPYSIIQNHWKDYDERKTILSMSMLKIFYKAAKLTTTDPKEIINALFNQSLTHVLRNYR